VADRDGVGGNELPEPSERRVLRVNGSGEAEVARGVLVPDVGDGRVGEGAEAFERGVHLGAGALKEDTATGDEERVAGEDGTGGGRRRVRGVGHVVADCVLRVAGRCETPVTQCHWGCL